MQFPRCPSNYSVTANLLTVSFFPSPNPFSSLPHWLYCVTLHRDINVITGQINVGSELPGCYVRALFSGAAPVQLVQGSRNMFSDNLTKSSKGLKRCRGSFYHYSGSDTAVTMSAQASPIK